jgi:glutamate/tyrosine decarboxylase-like PLP-dependent enzyme
MNPPNRPEPVTDLDWSPERARAFADGVTDIWQKFLTELPELPVSRDFDVDEVADAMIRDIPDEPMADGELMEYLESLALDWSMYPGHSGFVAYVSGAGTVPGAAADLLTAGLNQNVGGWRLGPGGATIQLHLMEALAAKFGLPEGTGGLFTSGGSIAGFIGLKLARDAGAPWDVRRTGVSGGEPLTMYASSETHDINVRSADMLGLGGDAVRIIPVDEQHRMKVDELRAAIAEDVAAGYRPFAVVASAGTVGTGSIDPLDEIADVASEHGIWFHVDGAYGAPASFVPELRPLFAGMERADTLVFDPHKWLYTPLAGGGLLVRNFGRLESSFGLDPSYTYQDDTVARRGIDMHIRSPQFSRSFQALKVWVSLLAHGWDAYVRRIRHDVELAGYLYALAASRAEFEVLPYQSLSIACYRYVPDGLPPGAAREEYLNDLNARLMMELQLQGRTFPSNAVVSDRFWLRACIVNFRTEAEDMEALLDISRELGRRLDTEMRPQSLRG